MAEKHVFTSDEIRAATDRLEEFGALNGVYVVVGNSLQNWDVSGDDILTMLRQFADEKDKKGVPHHLEYRVNKRGDFTCKYSERVFTNEADAEAWLEECKDKERELPISDADELYIESRKVDSWGDVNGENPDAFDLLLKLAAYLERSHDEWYVKFPNVGDSDMACQRMHNFVTDMHKVLDQFGIRDRVKELKAEKKRYQDYFFEFHGNKRQEKKCMEQLEWVNKWLAEELAKREGKK